MEGPEAPEAAIHKQDIIKSPKNKLIIPFFSFEVIFLVTENKLLRFYWIL